MAEEDAVDELSGQAEAIVQIPLEKIASAVEAFKLAVAPSSNQLFTVNDVQSLFADHMTKRQAAALASAIMGFVRVHEDHNVPYEALIASFITYISTKSKSSNKEQLRDALSPLAALFATDAIYEIYKASELYFDIDDRMDELRILTEARPVFSRRADEIRGYLIRNDLRIAGSKSGLPVEHSFTLSPSEIDRLIDQLQRAKKKSKTLQDELRKLSKKVAIQGVPYARK